MTVISKSAGYSSDWVSETGLDLEIGYCITMVRDVDPREALDRFGVNDETIRTAPWSELVAQVSTLEPPEHHGVTAAFAFGGHTVLVEDFGYRGRSAEWTEPLSQGTEAVNVYLSPSSLKLELTIIRDGQQVAFIDGDAPDDVDTDDPKLAESLARFARAALAPWDENDEPPESFEDGWVDLLQVACDYLGLRPTVSDISRPVLGAPVRVR
ncbi:DUF6461 domain-containing protein [Nocardia alni]|uniref:DUF6461 domain-containing protein n=1 Tax=Nocardia alni TaxID=2815723 RepID=UPI001C24A403|nr:DUF6461 domain-containing protein [Nocardia alni]